MTDRELFINYAVDKMTLRPARKVLADAGITGPIVKSSDLIMPEPPQAAAAEPQPANA
jgi:hypothetical protein